ncbi:MAG: hypothetical protein ACRDD8_14130 [Bacteroidales bacterium]
MGDINNINTLMLREVKFWQGTKEQYEEFKTNNLIEPDTIYFTLSATKGNSIYLGDKLMDDLLYKHLENSTEGGLTDIEVNALISKALEPVNTAISGNTSSISTNTSEIASIKTSIISINNEMTAINGKLIELDKTIVSTIMQIIEENYAGIIEAQVTEAVNTVTPPLVDNKVNAAVTPMKQEIADMKAIVNSLSLMWTEGADLIASDSK